MYTTLWYNCQINSCTIPVGRERIHLQEISIIYYRRKSLMGAAEFRWIRQKFLKTQKEMSELLGVSLKAVQSFEQGWRSIPAYMERLALFLLAMKRGTRQRVSSCWEIRHCPREIQETCPAWEFKSGHLCWFINGTICHGKPRKSWSRKMLLCKKCEIFSSFTKHWGLGSGRRVAKGTR